MSETKKPLRVLLARASVDAPRLMFPDNPWVGIPIGLLYLESALKLAGNSEIKILDGMAYPDFKCIRNPDSDGRFGLTDAEFEKAAVAFKPDLICFTVVAGRYLPDTLKAIRLVKEALPDAFIICGGHDVTARPQEYLYSDAPINAVVVAEGEEALVGLTDALRKGEPWQQIGGVAYVNEDGKFIKNPSKAIHDLDRYRLEFDGINLEQYFELYRQGFGGRKNISLRGNYRATFITTSRGCPYPCKFCSIYQTMGRRMRYHSVAYVLDLITRLVREHGVNHIHFEDDHLTADRERFKEIMRGIIERKLNITWDTPNGVRADSFDQEMLDLAKAAGVVYLMFGIESGDQQVLDKIIHKHLDLNVLEKTLAMCKKTGIDTMALFMIGLPGETREQIMRTYHYAFSLQRKYHTVPFLSLFKPFYDTPLYHTSKEQKFLIDFDKEADRPKNIPDMLFTPLMIETGEFNVEYLSKIYRNYMIRMGFTSTFNWMRITGRRPFLLLRLLGQFVRMAIGNHRQFNKVVFDFFWGAMIYPKSLLRRGDGIHWWLYEAAHRPAEKFTPAPR